MRNDCKHVALEKIRQTLNLLRKSNLGSNPLQCSRFFPKHLIYHLIDQYIQREDSLLNRMKVLQHSLRHDERDVIDPLEVVAPFLAILCAPYLAGPFKLVALDALQIFTSCNLFSEVPDRGGETLAKVVDAVIRCKFVQTDAAGDELVQLQIIHTLSNVIKSPVSCYLSDVTAWDIISASHSILIHIAATGSIKSVVYLAAEKTIKDASRFVFASAGAAITTELDLNKPSEAADFTHLARYSSGPSPVCAVKVMEFFIGILHKHCVEGETKTATGSNVGKRSASSTNLSGSGTIARHTMALGDQAISPSTKELLFALTAINAIFLAEGGLNASRALISNHEPLSSLVRDDLGRCLILLCSRRDLPPSVLQSVLDLFSLTVQLMGPSVRILIECFMRFIYIKAILQVRLMFASHDEAMRIILESQSSGSNSSKENTTSSNSSKLTVTSGAGVGFSIDEIEIILESLADLLADPGFIPSLFASFDCDPTKADIVQPLVKYLGTCIRYTLVSEPSELALGDIEEIGALIEQCYGQLSITLKKRNNLRAIGLENDELPNKESLDTSQSACGTDQDISISRMQWEKAAERLRLTRLAKGVLAEAALNFSHKPQEGLRYLQSRGVLPTPLTPASVAKFLRIAPGLPKESTGAFLGELGKDNPSYEADGKAFHREVLLSYVQSFELKGQTVLNCMRIFLSAFRLPGEAQQIDRILVAFSEYCHGGSIEGNNGLLENPEVTYLLTFSMIMLNTDLHNPNVRADRKMTTNQFVKNNAFYGEELNQTRPIPREYLETIYESLSQVPLRTERNDLNASITPEMWMDLQLQASIDAEKGLMLSTSYSPTMLRKITKKSINLHSVLQVATIIGVEDSDITELSDGIQDSDSKFESKEKGKEKGGEGCSQIDEKSAKDLVEPVIDDIAKVACQLLTAAEGCQGDGALVMSATFHGVHWIVDSDLLSCIFQDLLGVAITPFLMHHFLVAPTMSTVAPKATSVSYESGHGNGSKTTAGDGQGDIKYWRTRHAGVRALGVGIELSLELLTLMHSNHMQTVVDSLILLLAGFAKITIQEKFVRTMLKSLALIDFEAIDRESVSSLGPRIVSDRLKVVSYRNSIRESKGSTDDSDGDKVRAAAVESQSSDEMMEGLLTSIAARAALGTLLLVIHRHPSYLSRQCWRVTWIMLSLLRDCTLLPAQMVLLESSGDSDLLPPACRADFEMRLLLAERKEIEVQMRFYSKSGSTAPEVKKSASLMSLQGLGEALFGSSRQIETSSNNKLSYSSMPSRWDVGYESDQHPQITNSESMPESEINRERSGSSSASSFGVSSNIVLRGEKSREGFSEYEDEEAVLAAFICLREMVAACGVAQLVPDTRFLNENTMSHFFESLIATTETADGFIQLSSNSLEVETILETDKESEDRSRSYVSLVDQNLELVVGTISEPLLSACARASISASSVSWLENLLIEASLRNRDRLSIFWPSLSLHYETTITNAMVLTYSLERRITALFRLSARMINRDVFTAPILELFRLFFLFGKSTDENIQTDGFGSNSVDELNDTNLTVTAPSTPGFLNSNLLTDVAGQVSAGMWRVLTTNLDILPTLTLTQWQIVFDVIAVCAAAGGYASIKAFESMAWLLHESRLQGEIPMFCIVGIRPLLCNYRASIYVSVGAIKLLSHLHSRLEVLFTSEDDYVQVESRTEDSTPSTITDPTDPDPDHDSDTSVLWESCWTPILAAMAEGCADTRKPVRLAASNALSKAILDRHVRNVPVGLMVKILGDIYIAIILQLAEFLVKEKEPTKGRQEEDVEIDFKTSGVSAVSETLELRDQQELKLTVIPIMATLCKVFIEQVKRLSFYPSFDRLWLRLVHVFGYFLGAPHGFDHIILCQHQSGNEIQHTVTAAGDHLSTLTILLIELGIFKERSGLWEVTKDSLKQMKSCPTGLREDLLQESNLSGLTDIPLVIQ